MPSPTPTPTPTPTPPPPSFAAGPNVVLIVADDLNDFVGPLAGHPQALTPNLDRLASKGVTFTNAHANAPLCSPSRASFLSGYLPSTSGKYHSTYHFREHPVLSDAKLLPEHFRDNGYAVYTAGKVFHEGEGDYRVFGTSDPASHGTTMGDRSSGYIGPDSEFGPYPWDGITKSFNKPTRRVPGGAEGTDWVRRASGLIDILPGGSWNTNPDLPESLQGWAWGFGRISTPPTFTAGMNSAYPAGHSYRGFANPGGPFRYNSPTDRSQLNDERIASWASALIRGQLQGDPAFHRTVPHGNRSFMLLLGLTKTHVAQYMPDEYYDEFLAAKQIRSITDVRLPTYYQGLIENTDLADVPPQAIVGHGRKGFKQVMQAAAEGGAIPDLLNPGATIANNRENLLRSLVLTYLVAAYEVDRQVGVILDAVEADPVLRENTIFIVTSDHGWSAGEKTNWGKMSLWDESTRVPLIISSFSSNWDATRGRTSPVPASLVDLYPTLVDLAGLNPIPVAANRPAHDGQSLVPALRNPTYPKMARTPYAITSNFGDNPDSTSPGDPMIRNHTIKGLRWRYTLSRNSGQELYDHQNDPFEWHNIYNRAYWQSVKSNLDTELRREVGM